MVDPARSKDVVPLREPTRVCARRLHPDGRGRIWPVNVNADKGDI